jgi:hypothetical protein
MVDGLHKPIWNRTKRALAIGLSGVGRRLRGRDDGSNVTNLQYESNQNCHYKSPSYNEYILIKFYLKKQRHIWNQDLFYCVIVVLGVHCDIYKSSYNI